MSKTTDAIESHALYFSGNIQNEIYIAQQNESWEHLESRLGSVEPSLENVDARIFAELDTQQLHALYDEEPVTFRSGLQGHHYLNALHASSQSHESPLHYLVANLDGMKARTKEYVDQRRLDLAEPLDFVEQYRDAHFTKKRHRKYFDICFNTHQNLAQESSLFLLPNRITMGVHIAYALLAFSMVGTIAVDIEREVAALALATEFTTMGAISITHDLLFRKKKKMFERAIAPERAKYLAFVEKRRKMAQLREE